MTRLPGRIPWGSHDDDDELMALFRSLPDAEVDDLLAGRGSESPVAVALVDIVAALRADAPRHGAPPMSDALRRQITSVRPAVAPARRRRLAVAGALGLLFGTSAIGVAGAQNALPAALQDAASSAAGFVGIDLPRASERDDAPAGGEIDGNESDSPGGAGTTTDTGREGGSNADPKGPKETTPGGATPADPATPGDKGPATPADPADPATGNGSGPPDDPGQGGGQGQGGQGGGPSEQGTDASETGSGNQGGGGQP